MENSWHGQASSRCVEQSKKKKYDFRIYVHCSVPNTDLMNSTKLFSVQTVILLSLTIPPKHNMKFNLYERENVINQTTRSNKSNTRNQMDRKPLHIGYTWSWYRKGSQCHLQQEKMLITSICGTRLQYQQHLNTSIRRIRNFFCLGSNLVDVKEC